MSRLANKVAVITGGCSGIGLATVELFIAEGARVVIADVQDEKGQALAARFAGAAHYQHCDVTDEAQIAATMAASVAQFGSLDIAFIAMPMMAVGGPGNGPAAPLVTAAATGAGSGWRHHRGSALGVGHGRATPVRDAQRRGRARRLNGSRVGMLRSGWSGRLPSGWRRWPP